MTQRGQPGGGAEAGAGGFLPVVVVARPLQLKAFAHPTRVRLLELLIERPMTVKQLGDEMGMSAARAHYHLKFIERAGLVRLVERREKAGVVEKYYRAASRKYIVGSSLGTFGDTGAVILEALAGSIISGAIASAGGAPIGLVAGADERVTVRAADIARLLNVANTLQAAQDEFRALDRRPEAEGYAHGDANAVGGGDAGGGVGQAFELTYALYAAGSRSGWDTGTGGTDDDDDSDNEESEPGAR